MTLKQHEVLEDAELIRSIHTQPELEYLFRHALIQDAAYVSMLKTDRRGLHQKVATAFESIYSDRLSEFAPLLGWHFLEGGDDERALQYYTLAGDTTAQQYANAEKDIFFPAPILVTLARGELALARHDTAVAIALMDDIIAHICSTGVRPGITEALSSCRTLWQALTLMGDIAA